MAAPVRVVHVVVDAALVDLLQARVAVLELIHVERRPAHRGPAVLVRVLHGGVGHTADGAVRQHGVRAVLADGVHHVADGALAAVEDHRAVRSVPAGGRVATLGGVGGEGHHQRGHCETACEESTHHDLPYLGRPTLRLSSPHSTPGRAQGREARDRGFAPEGQPALSSLRLGGSDVTWWVASRPAVPRLRARVTGAPRPWSFNRR